MQTGKPSGVNPTILKLLYDTTPEELIQIDHLTKDFNEAEIERFVMMYRTKRKDPQTILILTLLGFVLVAGVHRFVLGHVGMGILYVFTAGLCLVGTIVDAINYKKLTLEYNERMIGETRAMFDMSRPTP